jgi:hypothetical protein
MALQQGIYYRQDGGFGIDVRVMRMSIAQVYLAEGRGAGLHFGYNLVKQF